MNERPEIILSPHFDDAVLSLGGTIAAAPDRAVVVTVFAGIPADGVAGGWDRRSGFATATAAMQARRAENAQALALLGVTPRNIRDLGHLDQQYRRTATEEPLAAIAADIRRLVGEHDGAVDLYAPASSWHPDHRLVGDAVLALARAGACPAAAIFLYQDQPYAYLELRRASLAPLRRARFGRLDAVAARRSGLALTRRLRPFEAAQGVVKNTAIGCYASQFRLVRPLLCKMIADFAYHQAREAGAAARYAEAVYEVAAVRP